MRLKGIIDLLDGWAEDSSRGNGTSNQESPQVIYEESHRMLAMTPLASGPSKYIFGCGKL